MKAVSFEETFNKTGLPIITLYNDAKELNFLLDTGSDCCVINSTELKYLHYTSSQETISTVDANGISRKRVVNIALNDGADLIYCTFVVMNLSAQFDEIHSKDGVRIHGILGSKFCKEAGLVIDFENLKVY